MTQAAEPTKTPPSQNECPQAYTNPKCPYITPINQNINAMKNVEKTLTALMGPDGTGLNSGVIHTILLKLDRLEDNQKVQHSWIENAKPYLVAVGTAVLTFLVTYTFTGHF